MASTKFHTYDLVSEKHQIVYQPMGHRCGYVKIPKGHPLWGLGTFDHIPGVTTKELWDKFPKTDWESEMYKIFRKVLSKTSLFDREPDIAFAFHCYSGVTFAATATWNDNDDWWFGMDTMDAAARGETKSEAFVDGELDKLIQQINELFPGA